MPTSGGSRMAGTRLKTKSVGNTFLETVSPTLAIVVFVRVFLVGLYRVPTASMADTIHVGDCVLGERISYRFTHPKPGDIVTFECPDEPGVTLVKRVIATEGQTIDIHDGNVFVDGTKQEEPYVHNRETHRPTQVEDSASVITYPHVIPRDYVWVMGDNRPQSRDSRWFGDVLAGSLTSRIVYIYWPLAHVDMVT